MKVLVAIDDSPFSHHVLELVRHRKYPDDTQFKVLTVIEPLGAQCESVIESEERTTGVDIAHTRTDKATALCEKARHLLEDSIPGSVVHFEIRRGKAADEVIKAATEWEASRIIIGAHGHSACPRNLTGSVSRAVGERATCAVEVVRPAVART